MVSEKQGFPYPNRLKLVTLVIGILVLVTLWFFYGDLLRLDVNQLNVLVARIGNWGPILIIILMATAIVLSPLPSAPIALTAGAMYGHTWGTFYVIIGAELGAIVAFAIARWFAHDFVARNFKGRIGRSFLGSQNSLTLIVFLSRLVPFISFDLVSYVAGLTKITTARFAIATLAGILPASFFLAHFGGELSSRNADRIEFALLVIAVIIAATFLVNMFVVRNPAKPD